MTRLYLVLVHTFYTYYCDLKVNVGRENYGPLYFMCRLKIRVTRKRIIH